VADLLAEQGDRPEFAPPADKRAAPRESPEPVRAPEDDVLLDGPPPIPLGLEIEHTSYAEGAESALPSIVTLEGGSGSEAVGPGGGPTGFAEMVAMAERAASEGDVERAAGWLTQAGEGLRSQRRWDEAVDAFRRLAALGRARDDQYAAWTEAARQAGMASLVLEALSAQARWHVEAGRRSSARKAAEEMLLVDPKNDLAAEILNQVGSTLPRD
jgi:hypothetical protein